MADINLNNGHRYTFGKINDNPVLSESTDFVQETAVFRQGIIISGSDPIEIKPVGSPSGIKIFDNASTDLCVHLYQSADDGYLKLYENNSVTTELGGSSPYFKRSLTVGKDIDSTAAQFEIGTGRTANGYAYIDLVGDTTYTDYGFRLQRGNVGANSNTKLLHRGTGNLWLETQDAGNIVFYRDSTLKLAIKGTQIEVSDDLIPTP